LEWWLIFIVVFGGLVVLLLSGLPVAFCFLVINVVGVLVFWGGEAALRQLSLSMFDSVTTFTLLPFPLFVLLGEVLFQTGLAYRAIDIVDMWLGRLPGRLSLVSVGAGVVLSTLSGSSVASVAILGSTMVPEMGKRGYQTPMTLGPIVASGCLAMMIPPSGMSVLLASLAYVSVGGLLMAGIIPGLMMAAFYAAYIIIRCFLNPSLAPAYKVAPMPLIRKIELSVRDLVPVAIIIFLVIGVILLGVATPSEAAAMGALGSFVLAACYRRLTWEMVKKCIFSSSKIAVMLLAIMLGAKAFGQILVFSGCMRGITEWVMQLPVAPITIIIGMQAIAVILGCFMDEVAIMMMVIPLYMPIVHLLGFDPLWFSLLLLINVETGLATPPFGLGLFVMQGVAPPGTKTGALYRSVAPFNIINLVIMGLCIVFPQIALWLPAVIE